MEIIGLPNRAVAESYTPRSPAPRCVSRRRSNLIVAIPTRPRYVPGTGPPLQPLRLLPPAEATGYIIERILLPPPGLAADGRPLPKRMVYIVGWHDLPAASLRVPAMDILQYVSPRVLEEWEDSLESEMDMHRQQLGDDAGQPGKDMVSQRVKRRPPAHTAIEQPAAVESEPDLGSPIQSQSLGLLRPGKRKLSQFEGSSDGSNSPTKQLARELVANKHSEGMKSFAVQNNRGEIAPAADGGLEKRGHARVAKCKPPSIITPVPLPPFGTYKSSHKSDAAPSNPRPTIVRLGMDSSSEPLSERDKAMLSVEGGSLSDGRGSITSRRERRASTRQAHEASAQRQSRSESSRIRRKKKEGEGEKGSKTSTPQARTSSETAETKNAGNAISWEVERIEDMVYYHVENRGLVRYFLVRWVGDWPPEQNPTWEPEENLPTKLIRTYTKLDKLRRDKLAAQHRRPPPFSGLPSQRHPRAVSEVLQGNVHQGSASVSANHYLKNDIFTKDEGVKKNGHRGKETPVPLPPTAFAFCTGS